MKFSYFFVFISFIAIDINNPALASKADPEERSSEQIFFQRCAGCHGVLRRGATGPALTPDKLAGRSDGYIESMITWGSSAGMPPFGASGDLSPEEIQQLVVFLRKPPPPLHLDGTYQIF